MSQAWTQLEEHRAAMDGTSLESLCDAPNRSDGFVLEIEDMVIDLTRHLATPETLDLLLNLAEERRLRPMRDAMFAGESVNTTEGRPALHVALRNRSDRPVLAGGEDVMPAVRDVLRKMQRFCQEVHDGTWKGATGRRIEHIVNIGIGLSLIHI